MPSQLSEYSISPSTNSASLQVLFDSTPITTYSIVNGVFTLSELGQIAVVPLEGLRAIVSGINQWIGQCERNLTGWDYSPPAYDLKVNDDGTVKDIKLKFAHRIIDASLDRGAQTWTFQPRNEMILAAGQFLRFFRTLDIMVAES